MRDVETERIFLVSILILEAYVLGNDRQLACDFRSLASAEAEVAALTTLGESFGALESPAEDVAAHDVGLTDERSELSRSDILRELKNRAAVVGHAVIELARLFGKVRKLPSTNGGVLRATCKIRCQQLPRRRK